MRQLVYVCLLLSGWVFGETPSLWSITDGCDELPLVDFGDAEDEPDPDDLPAVSAWDAEYDAAREVKDWDQVMAVLRRLPEVAPVAHYAVQVRIAREEFGEVGRQDLRTELEAWSRTAFPHLWPRWYRSWYRESDQPTVSAINLAPSGCPKVRAPELRISVNNARHLDLRVYRVDPETLRLYVEHDWTGWVDEPSKSEPVRQFRYHPKPDEWNSDNDGFHTELRIEDLPAGGYLVEIAVDGFQWLHPISSATVGASVHGTSEHALVYVANKANGSEPGRCELLFRRGTTVVARGRTGVNGLFAFRALGTGSNSNILVRRGPNDWTEVDLRLVSGKPQLMRPAKPRPFRRVWADREQYQPGQTVHFAIVGREPAHGGYRVPVQRNMQIGLRDGESVLDTVDVALDEYGTAEFSMVAPEVEQTTELQLYAVGSKNRLANIVVSPNAPEPFFCALEFVGDRLLPSGRNWFGVEVATRKGVAMAGDLTYKLEAVALPMEEPRFGSDDGVPAELAWFRRWGRENEELLDPWRVVDRGQVSLADGFARIGIPAKLGIVATRIGLRCTVTVTDAEGRTSKVSRTVAVRPVDLDMAVQLPSWEFPANHRIPIGVTISDLKGRGRQADVEIAVVDKRDGSRIYYQALGSDSQGRLLHLLPPVKEGRFQVIVTATDARGQAIREVREQSSTAYLPASCHGIADFHAPGFLAADTSANVTVKTAVGGRYTLALNQADGLHRYQLLRSDQSGTVELPITPANWQNRLEVVQWHDGILYSQPFSIGRPPQGRALRSLLQVDAQAEVVRGRLRVSCQTAHLGVPLAASLIITVQDGAAPRDWFNDVRDDFSRAWGYEFIAERLFDSSQCAYRQHINPNYGPREVQTFVEAYESSTFAESAILRRVETNEDGIAVVDLPMPHLRADWTVSVVAAAKDGRIGKATTVVSNR